MPYDLNGRNVLITGGSRGLGAVLARTFAAEGCNVAINYATSAERAQEVAGDINTKYDVMVKVIQADVGVAAQCKRLVEETITAFGGLDIIIANAGYTKYTPQWGDLDALDEVEWDKCWSVNVKGKLALFKAALPTFNTNTEGGVFLITSSVAGAMQGGSSMA